MKTSDPSHPGNGLREVVILLACALWTSTPSAQAIDGDDGTDPPITTAPGEDPSGGGAIDYENAEPMPLPSLPDPIPVDGSATPPPADGSMGAPGSSPGNTGTGEEDPEVLIPPTRD